MNRFRISFVFCIATFVVGNNDVAFAQEGSFRSHPPPRPLPTASQRPMADGPGYFVHPTTGNDANDGSRGKPWRTVRFAVSKLKPGDTLYLRGGVYYEHVVARQSGTKDKPITIRSCPGELAIIDGGLRQFAESAKQAWQPVDGAPGEYRSTQRFPQLERVVGNFADSLLPLHGYRNAADLRSTNEAALRDPDNKLKPRYLGPGVWYDADSERIHIRLAHTHINAFGAGNYRGETDPRKLSLVIAPWNATPLSLEKVKHVRIQDLVVRGGGDSTILVRGCEYIEFDGLTIFAANRGMRVETTAHLRVVNCMFRGTMPPWGSRTVSKYYAVDSHLFVPVGTYKIEIKEREYLKPQCRDFEIAHCEFTDGHDGVYVGGVKGLKFHHNLVDNMNDDGIYLSAWGPPGSDVLIYQNHLSRCLTLFAFGLGRGSESEPGDGVFIYRNLIDQRAPVPYGHPTPDAPALTSYGRLCGDHGGPIWEPLTFYHNTVITRNSAFRSYYGSGWGGHMRGSKRRVFNNIFVQIEKLPGLSFESPKIDLQAGGNLHWSIQDGRGYKGDFFAKFRSSPAFTASKNKYPAGWTTRDLFANPKFYQFTPQWQKTIDLRLRDDSPAINAGVKLANDWPDALRIADKGAPDLGALPVGVNVWNVGPVVSQSP